MSDLGLTKQTTLSMEAAEAAVRDELAAVGFGVLTEIDVQVTLKTKIDVDRPPYKILGACNPVLANQALTHDEAIGLLLPCNVTLSDHGDGTTVSIIDPVVMLGIAGDDPEMLALASEAREKLAGALDRVPSE